jgi:glutathione S-transferase
VQTNRLPAGSHERSRDRTATLNWNACAESKLHAVVTPDARTL